MSANGNGPETLPLMAYSTEKTGTILGLTPAQVRGLIRTGKLRARTTGKAYLVPKSALEEYLAGSDEPIKAAG